MMGHSIHCKGVILKIIPTLFLLSLLIWSTEHAYKADVKMKFLGRIDYVSFTKHIKSIYLQFYHSLEMLIFQKMHNSLKYNDVIL